MKEGLLCLQFAAHDRARVMRLARFIADIEPRFNESVDVLFVARFDQKHDPATVEYVSRKFHVSTFTAPSRALGYPWGCWVLWFSIAERLYHLKAAGKLPAYKWSFAIEGDTCPLSPTWLAELAAEWDRLKAYVVGAETFHWRHHINGNLMLSTDLDFLRWLVLKVTIMGVPPPDAWDIWLFPYFARWGVGFSPRMVNGWGKSRELASADFDALLARKVSFVHGVKDDSLFNLASAALLPRQAPVILAG